MTVPFHAASVIALLKKYMVLPGTCNKVFADSFWPFQF